MGEGPREVGVLLQDIVPFTRVDASCGVSRIKCCYSVLSRAPVKPKGLSRFFVSVVMDDETIIDSASHTDAGVQASQNKTEKRAFQAHGRSLPRYAPR